jgi:BspA type Leucine rich repeat region (6 copies)
LVLPEFLTYLGSQAFYNCGYSTCKSLPSTPPALYNTSSLGNLRIVFVPKASEAAYKSAWSNYMIIGGDTLTSVNVTLTNAGTLGDEILKKISYLKDVHKLTVSGPMNTTDMTVIQQSMPSLVSLNLKAAQLVQIPDNQFNGKELLLEVILPDSMETIGYQAFRGCINLTTIRIPEKVKSLPNYTFYACSNLASIDFTEGLTSIGYECFYNCYSLEKLLLPQSLINMEPEIFIYCYKLKSVNIPPKVKTLNYNTFYNCTSLERVTFSDGLTSIGTYVFYDCALTNLVLPDNLITIDDYAFYSNNIKSVVLPAKLVNLGNYSFAYCPIDSLKLPAGLSNIESGAFGYCASLKDIRCEQPTPPVLSNDPFVGFDKTKCSLTVSSWAANMYKQANIWSSFYPVYTYNSMIKELPISGSLVLSDNVRPLGTPNVTVLNTGSLRVSGNAPLTINQFKMDVALNRYYYYGYVDSYGQLISESPSITASRVGIDMSAYAGLWYYLAFPFDARVDSMSINNNAQFVFRKYDGAARAANGAGSSWKTMTKDSVLKASEGYVYQSNVDALLNVLSTEASRNQMFNSTTRNVQLKEFASASPSNKNWNFVGNPYPSFFDVFYLDFTAPITVWNYANSTYQALSLADDDYILKPYEAFFVQKPNDLSQISFRPEGRQLTNAIRANRSAMAKLRSATDRTLINLNISNDTYTDKCRVVINPSASLSYDMESDASKFMSSQLSVPQLYSMDDTGVKYAINERPLESGVVRLGCYIGEAGTYTLAAINLPQDGENVILTDKLLKKQTILNSESYQFSADMGTHDNRFELSLLKNATKLVTTENNQTSVWCLDGTINVITKAGNKISVFELNGVLVKETVAKGTRIQIPLEKGVYLVNVAGKIFKSVVF